MFESEDELRARGNDLAVGSLNAFTPARIMPFAEEFRHWSERTFGATHDRLAKAEGLRRHLVQEVHEIIADPEDWVEYADVFLLAMDMAWRCEGSRSDVVAVELLDSLGAKRIPLSPRAIMADLKAPYIPKATDIMAWAIRSSAERGLSSEGFLRTVGKKHAINVKRHWPSSHVEGEPINHLRPAA